MYLNRDLEVDTYMHQKVNPHPFAVNLGNRFSKLDDKVIWKKELSDSIFLIENNQTKKFMRFDFGEDWAWSDPKARANQKSAFNTIWKDSSKVWEVISKVGQRYVFLTYYFTIMENGKGIIDRKTGKFYRFDMRKKNKEHFDVFALQWQEDELVCSLQAYDLEEFLENLDKSQYAIAGGLRYEDIKYSENPVLLKIKFKIPD